ncbi:DNA alkylation repair protein [Rohdeia mirabilis]|uniref:DNA alkylation repair protein n=1 Tax=Rohdeia mirabilis TaxID=2528008 RepID=UPI003AF3C721
MSARTRRLQRTLAGRASGSTRAWWERYLKGEAAFRGVPMAEVRRATKAWWHDEGLDGEDVRTGRDAALDLFASRFTEDKLAGTIALAELCIENLGDTDLPAFARLFDLGHVGDWNVTDWFAVKLLANLVCESDDPARTARAIADWRKGRTLWQRRAGLVAFANLARHGDAAFPGQTDLLLETADVLVRDPERFSQTAVGWVLRELGVAEPERVSAFARDHRERLSREALRNLTAKLDPASRKALRDAHAAR